MATLCREFGISRVTGYKLVNRYNEVGLDALCDRSRAPYRQAYRLPYQIERLSSASNTLKSEATKPPSFDFLQQQERFDHFVGVYNNQRPHQALGGAYPADVYTPSARPYERPAEPEYPCTTAPSG